MCTALSKGTFELLNCPAEICSFENDRDAFRLVEEKDPALLISGLLGEFETSMDYRLQRAARNLKIPVLTVLDSWMHLPERFVRSKDGSGFEYLPDMISVMDQKCADKLVHHGIPSGNIAVTGHPIIQYLKEKIYKPSSFTKTTWVFYSEPLSIVYGDTLGTGFNEVEAFSMVIKASRNEQNTPRIQVKEHPRHSTLEKTGCLENPQVELVDINADPYQLIFDADIIFGMSSSLLVWAFLLGKKVVPMLPGGDSDWQDMNILIRRNYIPNANTQDALKKILDSEIDSSLQDKLRAELFWHRNTADECADLAYSLLK
ncbi:hypothetical protein FMR86_08500 [Desulfovibrio sp. JC010]|nr:hypothetical protein [Desulfovibrio sp. JC010]